MTELPSATGSNSSSFSPSVRGNNVTAVLGPTNTGKTHLAIERMLGHQSGMIGLPLRLLAREVFDKIVSRIGSSDVALITGEQRIKPSMPRYYVCTVEAMPQEHNVDFLAIDEIQLAADPERGHVFTDRLLHARGVSETLLLGAATMKDSIADLLPGANFVTRPRLSKLAYAGQKKLTRLPRRSAIVAFSANDVYEIAELIRRQRGGAAVVLGALSPRTRNAQVELYQSGDVDFLVATDAIGMGLNLDVDHVAFAGSRKFDGQLHRELTPAELSQIAGRAGRHMNDGTFGVTANVEPFDSDIVNRLENHEFEQVKVLHWRNRNLDFTSLERLKESLNETSKSARLSRARLSDDVIALENVSHDEEVRRLASAPAALRKLWDVCQIPDYRKISIASHTDLVVSLFKHLMSFTGQIPEDWIAKQVAFADKTDGDIDTLANRISHIRTWTFVSHKVEWLNDPERWQERTREIEDRLSDALHEKLTERFVDKRTSVLMRRLRDQDDLYAEILEDGAIHVEKHFVGRLTGFEFAPDSSSEGIHGKAARHAANKILAKELEMRARRVGSAKDNSFTFTQRGRIEWHGEAIAKLEPSENPMSPTVTLIASDQLSASNREKVQKRLDKWISDLVQLRLKPLIDLQAAEDISGLARGIAFRLNENFGILKREDVADEMRSLDQQARAQLRKFGIRFGAFNIYFPILLKPASSELLHLLWLLKTFGADLGQLDNLPDPPRAGLTSCAADKDVPEGFYRAAGYHLCGDRVVRIDMLERLADMIRPLVAWRTGKNKAGAAPSGATGDGGFTIQADMMSIMGCSPEELGAVLHTLGFRMERRRRNEEKSPEFPATEQITENEAQGAASRDTHPDGETQEPQLQESPEISGQPENSLKGEEPNIEACKENSIRSDRYLFEEIWRPKKIRNIGQQKRGGATFSKEKMKPHKRKSQLRRANKPSRESRLPPARSGGSKNKARDTIDPDSPFAALSKLKQELEDQMSKN